MASTFVTVPSPLFSLRKTNNLSRSKQRRLLGPPTQSLRVSAIATKWEPSKVVPQADRVLVQLEQLPEMQKKHCHSVALKVNEQIGTKRGYTYIQSNRAWLPKALVLWIMVMAFISMHIYRSMDEENKIRRNEVLGSMCDQRTRMLQDQFNVSVDHVHALTILVSTFHYLKNPSAIDQETFAEYAARTAFERPLLTGVAYAPRVVDAQREQFERQHGWTIKTMEREPSPVRDEYAPVMFNQESLTHIKSLDMMSGEEDRENILRARATGKAVLTRPFKLLGSHHLGVVLTFPVYKSKLPPIPTVKERIEATAGWREESSPMTEDP